jgi:valyl-tRNA synthetase
MVQPYPQPDEAKRGPQAEDEMSWVKGFVLGLRKVRSEMDIPPGKRVPVVLQNASPQDLSRVETHGPLLEALARIASIETLTDGAKAPESATTLLGEMRLLIPLEDLIDKDAETARLNKEIDKLMKDLSRSESKLKNPSFIERAPKDVVEKEQGRVREFKTAIDNLNEQLETLARI